MLASCDVLMNAGKAIGTSMVPTNGEIINGLKEALKKGVTTGTLSLNKPNAFFGNELIKILIPDEVKKVEERLRFIGLGGQVDKAIKAMNEGAENAMATAKPIFVNAITGMSFTDAMEILKGGNSSATNYLRLATTENLHLAFKPEIQKALDKVGATKYWKDIFTTYNSIPLVEKKVDTDLAAYVTSKATHALFLEVEKQENLIRQDPVQRTTEILKKVFNYADTQK